MQTSPSNVPSASNATKSVPPRRLVTEGVRNGSTEAISSALQLDPSLLSFALSSAVRKGSVTLTTHLLNNEHASVDTLPVSSVATEPSIELLDILVSAGWNLNQRSNLGLRLLDMVTSDEELVRWCLDHGAKVSDGKDDEDDFKYPPITEETAALGTVSCFKLLRANNARLGRRTLHRAASSAAHCAAVDKSERMAMLEYLIKEERLNVNQLDTNDKLAGHLGTPIAYAAKEKDGADVVAWLLNNGADPKIRDYFGNHDALSLAEFYGNEEVARVLRQSIEKEGDD